MNVSAIDYTFQSNYGVTAAWTTSDVIGIYAKDDMIGGNTQTRFNVNSVGSDTHKATTQGFGIKLNNNWQYFALSPYNASYYANQDLSTALPIAYSTPTQTGNNGLAHLKAADLQTASVTTTSANTASFAFTHLGAVIRLSVMVPDNEAFTQMALSTTQGGFLTAGTLNLETGIISNRTTESTIALNLDNINVNRGEQLITYLPIHATDLTGGTLTATFSTASGKTYHCSFDGFNVLAGKAYAIGRTLQRGSATTLSSYAKIANSTNSLRQPEDEVTATPITNPECITTDFLLDKEDISYSPLPPMKGDANNDGKVDNDDLTITEEYILGKMPDGFYLEAADTNDDGNINAADLVGIAKRKQ